MTKLSEQYEKLYPGTGCSESQAHERMERLNFKERQRSMRKRGIMVPELPWKGDETDGAESER
jgi:hypothetical protein